MSDIDEETVGESGNENPRRILKVRLRQDQVLKLHELRILQGKSIANLLEDILDEYFNRSEPPAEPASPPVLDAPEKTYQHA